MTNSPFDNAQKGTRTQSITGNDYAGSIQDQNLAADKKVDPESQGFLKLLEEQEKVRINRVPSVRTVLVLLSARWMPYDRDSLRQKILLSYPDSTVFFRTTLGKPVGAASPQYVDLLIDFTGPGDRQRMFHERKLKRMARVTVGRNAGFFRKKLYDRVFDDKAKMSELPYDPFERERLVHKEVLAMAGVPLSQHGETPQDKGKSIALELPPMQKL